MRALAALSLLVLLAGCTSSPAPAADPSPTAAPGPQAIDPLAPRPAVDVPTFLPPIELGSLTGGAEPSVAIAPDGTVYVTSPLALWRSDDGGKTYMPMGEAVCPAGVVPACPGLEEYDPGLVGGGDASLAVTPDGIVHWAGLGGGIPYQRSLDRGESWSEDMDVSNGTGSDREWVAVDPDSGLLTAQWRGSDDDGAATFMRASADSGVTWSNVTRAADDGRQGPIAHDPTSSWMILPHQVDGMLYVARSADGKTWTDEIATPVNGRPYIFPVAAFDQNGTVYLVHAADPDNVASAADLAAEVSRVVATPHVYLQVSHDKGATWTPPQMLSTPDVPAFFPWIDAGAPGRIVVAWYEAQQPVPANRLPNVFDVKLAISSTADQAKPTFAIGQANTEPVHVGAFCTEGSFCSLSGGDRSMLDFFEVRVHPDGTAIVAWAADDEVKQARIKVFATKMTGGLDLLH